MCCSLPHQVRQSHPHYPVPAVLHLERVTILPRFTTRCVVFKLCFQAWYFCKQNISIPWGIYFIWRSIDLMYIEILFRAQLQWNLIKMMWHHVLFTIYQWVLFFYHKLLTQIAHEIEQNVRLALAASPGNPQAQTLHTLLEAVIQARTTREISSALLLLQKVWVLKNGIAY